MGILLKFGKRFIVAIAVGRKKVRTSREHTMISVDRGAGQLLIAKACSLERESSELFLLRMP